jgi:hypothetical protein
MFIELDNYDCRNSIEFPRARVRPALRICYGCQPTRKIVEISLINGKLNYEDHYHLTIGAPQIAFIYTIETQPPHCSGDVPHY